jgi:flap endonuclease-1
MGIPKLNKLLIERCSQKAIYKTHLENLYEKKIAVDISIYLYRFLADGNFMEHLYLFLSLFKYYCIEPIFIFDGKPPVEKYATIKKRKLEKQAASKEYAELEAILETSEENKYEIEKRMDILKTKMIRVKWEDIDKAIELIQSFGFTYYIAPHEADQLCTYLSVKNMVYAVMSDDMDMIISGCSYVIRNFNMSTHEVFIYNNTQILHELNISLEHFRQIIILSGTDYDTSDKRISIRKAFDLYQQFSQYDIKSPFYEWLSSQEIDIDRDELDMIYNLFDITPYMDELNTFIDTSSTEKKKMSVAAIKTIMKQYRFIFL